MKKSPNPPIGLWPRSIPLFRRRFRLLFVQARVMNVTTANSLRKGEANERTHNRLHNQQQAGPGGWAQAHAQNRQEGEGCDEATII
jgi:hypothetical protein